jgi:molybdopterin/thiamine biosynthesis adenylyltransferase
VTDAESFYRDLFKMMLLILSEEDQRKIRSAKVGLAGLGGVGCPILEVLLRNGVNHLRIAEVDRYESHNYRQLYCMHTTVGASKADVATKHSLEVNPYCQIELFKEGVTHENYLEFCQGLDILCAQADNTSTQLLLEYAASVCRIPVVNGGRAGFPDRHTLAIYVRDYRRDDVKFEIEYSMERRGIQKQLREALKAQIASGRVDPELLKEIDQQNSEFRQETFRRAVLDTPEAISDKDREYLLQVISNNPDKFHKMAVTPQGVMIVGAMAAQHVLDIILGREVNRIAVNIYRGKAYEFSRDHI